MSEQLNRYLEKWALSDPQLLAETVSGHIYAVMHNGQRVVLKLLTAIGQEEKVGAVALRYWGGRGAVQLLREDDEAHLLEYADGDDLIPMVKSGGDEQATAIIANVLNQLHAATTEALPEGLMPLKVWFRSLFKKGEIDRQAGIDSVYVRAARLAEEVLAQPRDVRVIHGDMHHENVRSSRRGWLAFDPKGLIGERAYDAANTLCNPIDMPELVENEERLLKNAVILAQVMDIELPRVLTFVFLYVCLSASWYVEDGVYPRRELRIAEIVEPHLR